MDQPQAARGFAGFLGYSARQVEPARVEQEAQELDRRAAERASYGDAREAGVLRARAAAVRKGQPDPGWS